MPTVSQDTSGHGQSNYGNIPTDLQLTSGGQYYFSQSTQQYYQKNPDGTFSYYDPYTQGYTQPKDSTQPPNGVGSPSAPGTGGPPSGGNFSDPTYAGQFIDWYANQPGADPTLKSDRNYWLQKLTSGELGSDPNYIISKFMGAGSGGGSGAAGGTGQVDPYTAPTPGGDLANPLKIAPMTMPTLADLLSSPGYQVGLDTIFKGIERHQAAQGSVLDGGARSALIKGGEDYAQTKYNDLVNQFTNLYQTNASTGLNVRQQNNTEFQQGVGNNLNQYNARYQAYKDAINNQFNLANLGLQATQAGNTPSPTA